MGVLLLGFSGDSDHFWRGPNPHMNILGFINPGGRGQRESSAGCIPCPFRATTTAPLGVRTWTLDQHGHHFEWAGENEAIDPSACRGPMKVRSKMPSKWVLKLAC